jgi:hypothetical protein
MRSMPFNHSLPAAVDIIQTITVGTARQDRFPISRRLGYVLRLALLQRLFGAFAT